MPNAARAGGPHKSGKREHLDSGCSARALSGKQKAALRRLVLDYLFCLFFDGVSGVPRCILHIARGIMGGSLGLIDLPFGFHTLVTTELTGTLFDGAFYLLGSALHVFAIHDVFLSVWDTGQRKSCVVVPRRTSGGLAHDDCWVGVRRG
jgi:hypothetical protein